MSPLLDFIIVGESGDFYPAAACTFEEICYILQCRTKKSLDVINLRVVG